MLFDLEVGSACGLLFPFAWKMLDKALLQNKVCDYSKYIVLLNIPGALAKIFCVVQGTEPIELHWPVSFWSDASHTECASILFYAEGSKFDPYLTPKLKVIETPNLACGLAVTKFFIKLVLSWWRHYCGNDDVIFSKNTALSKNDGIFAMTSQEVQISSIGLFFETESYNA